MKASGRVGHGLILTILTLSLPQAGSAHAEVAIDIPKIRVGPCPGFEGGSPTPREIEQFYATRAIDIVRAATSGDVKKLEGMVAPAATFVVWRGDYTSSARDRGVKGAVELARDIKARRFQLSSIETGPLVITQSLCNHDVTILFESAEEFRGAVIKFSFNDGILVEATGNGVYLFEGDIPQN